MSPYLRRLRSKIGHALLLPPSVAAVIKDGEGRILRQEKSSGEGWCLPAGAIEPGETPEQALERELEEELGIRSETGEEILRYDYSYRDKPPFTLIFFRVRRWEGEPQHLNYSEMRWERPERLCDYSFIAGDERFLRELRFVE